MTDAPPVLEIRYAPIDQRWGVLVAAVTCGGLILLGLVLMTAAAPDDRQSFASGVAMVASGLLLGLAFTYVARRRESRPYARLDERGILWGVDRAHDLSLDWSAIQSIRIVPNPARLTDSRTFIFQAVASYSVPARLSELTRWSIGPIQLEYGTPFVINTLGKDCRWRDLLAFLEVRLPGLPIVEGSFLTEA